MVDLERYWVIGDVHGCMFTLESLANKLPKDSELLFVGDLIDRGLYSKEVVEFVIENGYKSVLGNHEYLFIKYAKNAIYKNFTNFWSQSKKRFGGFNTIISYKNSDNDTFSKHLSFFKKLSPYLIIDDYFITHGFALPYYKDRDRLGKNSTLLFTNRLEDLSYYRITREKEDRVINIFGHTPYDDVLFDKNYIGVDTGAVYNNKLSALNLKTKEVVSQHTLIKDII